MLLERRSKEAEICRDQLPQPRRLLAIKLFPPVEAAGNLADEQVGCAPRRELSEGELAQLPGRDPSTRGRRLAPAAGGMQISRLAEVDEGSVHASGEGKWLADLFPMVAVVEAACKEEPPITLSPGVGSRS